jgi:hypothetical protein
MIALTVAQPSKAVQHPATATASAASRSKAEEGIEAGLSHDRHIWDDQKVNV